MAPITGLLVIDMQAGLFTPEAPRYDAEGVVTRINAVADATRRYGGTVVFIQHDGPPGDTFEPGTAGWQLLPSLERKPQDALVRKTACDAFYRSELGATLDSRNVRRLLVTGCATEFCVDTTIRAALSRDYEVIIVADGHTTTDRQHVDAESLIQHHNWLWRELIHPKMRIEVLPATELIARLGEPS